MDFASLEKTMAEASQVTYSQIKLVPAVSGVYSAWLRSEFNCFYIGKAGNLAHRLRSHYSGQRGGNQFCLYVYDSYVYKL